MLNLSYLHPAPVIQKTADIRYGFEGGRAVKVGGTYHLFTSEMAGPPIWVNMRLGHWTSPDRLHWAREGTVRRSTGDATGKDTHGAIWSPLPAWDESHDEWNLFYVAYRSLPNTPQKFLANHDGRICRLVSAAKGPEGIRGPWVDRGVVMQPGLRSQPWEGLQGVDSFFPWFARGQWRCFYGSARSEVKPVEYWRVGLATAPELAGPWTRDPRNPSEIEPRAIENPIVERVPGGGWIVVYDRVDVADSVGWAFSADGVTWGPGRLCKIPEGWCKFVRTPLGLISEGGDKFTMFYSGFEAPPNWDELMAVEGNHACAIGFAELKIHF